MPPTWKRYLPHCVSLARLSQGGDCCIKHEQHSVLCAQPCNIMPTITTALVPFLGGFSLLSITSFIPRAEARVAAAFRAGCARDCSR